MHLVSIEPRIAFAQAEWRGLTDRERAERISSAIAGRLSKSDLAERIGVSFQAVHAWTVGDTTVDWSRWMSICLALGIPETWQPTDAQLAKAKADIDALRPAAKQRRRAGKSR